MSAYLFIDLDVHDNQGFQRYRDAVPAFIAKHGGEYLARGGEFEVHEGDWQPHRIVLFRFPNREAIRSFFADPEYAALKELRVQSARTIAVSVDGID